MNPISISEKMMFNTVRLETNNGTGTGFFYSFHVGKYEYLTIITNKHVVNNNPKEIVKFSLHLADDDGGSTKNISIQMESNWYFHPSKDLCFAFVQPIFKQVEEMTGKKVFYRANGAEILATEEQLQNLSALEELVMVGYPIGMFLARLVRRFTYLTREVFLTNKERYTLQRLDSFSWEFCLLDHNTMLRVIFRYERFLHPQKLSVFLIHELWQILVTMLRLMNSMNFKK